MEEREDREALECFSINDDGFRVPHEIVQREIINGEHPVKLWREHRGLTIELLAEHAGISKAFRSHIENAKRKGTVKTLKALTVALQVPLDILISK